MKTLGMKSVQGYCQKNKVMWYSSRPKRSLLGSTTRVHRTHLRVSLSFGPPDDASGDVKLHTLIGCDTILMMMLSLSSPKLLGSGICGYVYKSHTAVESNLLLSALGVSSICYTFWLCNEKNLRLICPGCPQLRKEDPQKDSSSSGTHDPC